MRKYFVTIDSCIPNTAPTDFVNVPKIVSSTGKYGTEGGTLTLNCTVSVDPYVKVTIKWETPNGNASILVKFIEHFTSIL